MELFFRPDKPARVYVVIFNIFRGFTAVGGENDSPLGDLFGWQESGR